MASTSKPAQPQPQAAKAKAPPAAPRSEWRVRGGEVFKGAKKMGTVDRRGMYRVVDERGTMHTGSVGALVQRAVRAQLRAKGPSGQLRFDTDLLEVRGGVATLGGARVGTVREDGTFEVIIAGVRSTGNVQRTIGAVWLGTAKANPGSGRIEAGGHVFRAVDGVIFEDGEEIGWLNRQGRFRAVTLDGHFLEGQLGKRQVFLKRA